MPAIGGKHASWETALFSRPSSSQTYKYPINDALHTILDAIVRQGDSHHTRRAYAGDLTTYARWLARDGRSWDSVTSDDLDRYREWLSASYARTTTNRRLTVVRALYGEAVRRKLIEQDPGDRLRGIRGRDDRDGGALTRGEARELFTVAERDLLEPRRRLRALRDLAILALLVRTGLRLFEVVCVQIGDLATTQGHSILTLRAGKGNVARTIKLPPDVRRTIDAWLTGAADAGLRRHPTDPLFVEVRKGGRIGCDRPLSDRAIHSIVTCRLQAAGLERLGPHALRATFVTLALEGGAPLHIVQQAAGHADPRTTERYWRRKNHLDDNAVDYIRL